MRFRLGALPSLALLATAGVAGAARAQDFGDEDDEGPSLERISVPLEFDRPWGRGPLPIRDPMPLAAMRLALHPFSPDTARPGEPQGRVEVTWGNTFLDGDASIVDAEIVRAAIEIRDGVTDTVDAGLEVPIVWRGGGILDGVANFLHDAFGTPDGGRADFPDDRHHIAVASGGEEGELDRDFGLGDVVVSTKALVSDGYVDGVAVSLLGEVRLPTAADDLGADGFDAGITAELSSRVLDRVVVYGGAGGTYFFDDRHEGFEYESFRGYGFFAVEWEALEWASLLVQADLATPLLRSPGDLDGWQSYAHFGAVVDVAEETRLELAFVENIEDQDATADFALFAGVSFRF